MSAKLISICRDYIVEQSSAFNQYSRGSVKFQILISRCFNIIVNIHESVK